MPLRRAAVMRQLSFIVCALAALVALAPADPTVHVRAQPPSNAVVDLKTYQDLRWRSVGPHRGGRSTAAAGVRTQPNVFYMGATGGGGWENEKSGTTPLP